MSRAISRRLLKLEELRAAPPRPWLVLMPGDLAPVPLPAHYGGIVRLAVFDGRKP